MVKSFLDQIAARRSIRRGERNDSRIKGSALGHGISINVLILGRVS